MAITLRAGRLITTQRPEEWRIAVLGFGLGSLACRVVQLLSLPGPVAALLGAGLLFGYSVFQRIPDAPGDERGR